MRVLCVIPARIASTRLERKPLALIKDKPLVQCTYEAARQCKAIDQIVVATDSDEVAKLMQEYGAVVAMTDADIKTGSDRVARVARDYPDYDIVINLQGDEPFINPVSLSVLITAFKDNSVKMATLAYPLDFENEYIDPNIVKVIRNQNQNAIYFSRAPIPHFRAQHTQATVLHHVGVYAFRRDFLQVYTQLSPTPLEQAESLEQLRALEHGYAIKIVATPHRTLEINTASELARAQSWGDS